MGLRCWNGATCTRSRMESFASRESKRWPVPYAGLKPPKVQATAPGHCRQSRRPPPLDFRRLLKLYMAHVLHEEGVTYVRGLLLLSDLTPEQSAAISEIEAEVKKENPHDYLG